jgi:pentatricopeptide repeat protein
LKYYAKAEKEAKEDLKNEMERLYNSMANTYLKMRKYDESIEYFNKGIKINPKLDMLYYNMANVYKEIGKIE